MAWNSLSEESLLTATLTSLKGMKIIGEELAKPNTTIDPIKVRNINVFHYPLVSLGQLSSTCRLRKNPSVVEQSFHMGHLRLSLKVVIYNSYQKNYL